MRRFLLNVIVFVLLLPLYVLWVVSWLYGCLVEAIIKFVVNGRKVVSGYPFFDGFILGEEGAKEIANRLEAQKKKCLENEGLFVKTKDECHEAKLENKRLRETINEFNKTRRPWERKLNIEMK